MNAIPGPWAWQNFGSRWVLVGDYGPRNVVLTAQSKASHCRKCGELVPMPHLAAVTDDQLVELTPDHPVAELLADAHVLAATGTTLRLQRCTEAEVNAAGAWLTWLKPGGCGTV